jgi:hypothetical protein
VPRPVAGGYLGVQGLVGIRGMRGYSITGNTRSLHLCIGSSNLPTSITSMTPELCSDAAPGAQTGDPPGKAPGNGWPAAPTGGRRSARGTRLGQKLTESMAKCLLSQRDMSILLYLSL